LLSPGDGLVVLVGPLAPSAPPQKATFALDAGGMSDPVLSSQMSYGAILKVYQDYSDYDLLLDPNRARIFIKAGRMMLALALRRSSQSSRAEEVELEPEILERQTKAAIAWLASYNAYVAGPRQVIPSPCWRDESIR
jgi:hypothetical protein